MLMPIGQLHIHAAIAAVVLVVGWLVSYQVLRAQLSSNLRKRAVKRQHIPGKERCAAGLVAKPLKVFISFVLDLTRFNSRHHAKQSGLGGNREQSSFGSLRDIDRVADVGAAVRVDAVGDYHQGAPPLGRTHLLVTELPDS